METYKFIKVDEPLLITGIAEVDNNSSKILANEIQHLDAIRQKNVKSVELNLNMDRVKSHHLKKSGIFCSNIQGIAL